jgi:hypothetical protein
MESYNNTFNDMSNTNINVKLKEIGIEYEFLKQEILRICDRMETLEKDYIKGKEELKKRGIE